MPLTLGINLSITGTITIQDAGGGEPGGGVTPLVSSDFKNGVYEINGVSAAVGDVWAADVANWGAFNPATDITAAGLVSGFPIVKHPLVDDLLSGFVMVVDFVPGTAIDPQSVNFQLTDFPGYTTTLAGSFGLSDADTMRVTVTDYTTTDTQDVAAVAAHKAAYLFSNAQLAVSLDGQAISTFNPIDVAPTDFGVGVNTDGGTIEKIEFFSLADYDASDLPTLSA